MNLCEFKPIERKRRHRKFREEGKFDYQQDLDPDRNHLISHNCSSCARQLICVKKSRDCCPKNNNGIESGFHDVLALAIDCSSDEQYLVDCEAMGL